MSTFCPSLQVGTVLKKKERDQEAWERERSVRQKTQPLEEFGDIKLSLSLSLAVMKRIL